MPQLIYKGLTLCSVPQADGVRAPAISAWHPCRWYARLLMYSGGKRRQRIRAILSAWTRGHVDHLRCKCKGISTYIPNFFVGVPWYSVLVPFFSLLIPFFWVNNKVDICNKVRHYPDFHVGWCGRREAIIMLLVPQASVWRTRLWSVLSSFHARLFCGYDRVPQNLFRYLKRQLAVIYGTILLNNQLFIIFKVYEKCTIETIYGKSNKGT